MSKFNKVYTNIDEFDKIDKLDDFVTIQIKEKNVGILYNLMKYFLTNNDYKNAQDIYNFLIEKKIVKWRHSLLMLNYLVKNNPSNVSIFYYSKIKPFIDIDKRVVEFLINHFPIALKDFIGFPIMIDHTDESCDCGFIPQKIPIKQTELLTKFTQYVKDQVGDSKFPEFFKIISKIPVSINLVVDGNNILLTKGGKITAETLKFYHKMIKNIEHFEYLIFIHQRHQKFLKGKIDFSKVIFTPKGFNDDWFTIFTAIFKQCYLFSDDLFRDHIYSIDTCYKSFDFKIFLDDYQVKSSSNYEKIIMPLNYSRLIQGNNTHIHIPAKNGFKCVKI